MYISQIIRKLTETGLCEIEEDVYLFTREQIIEDQQGWDDKDPCKNMDFTNSPLWLTTGSQTPIPYSSFSEYITENYERLNK